MMSDSPGPTVYLGLDDTDTLDTPGTGQHARHLAGLLAQQGAECAVSRHQLLVHPDVPMTKRNSANVIHVRGWRGSMDDLFRLGCDEVGARAADGSDPAVCLGDAVPRDVQHFGLCAQQEVLKPAHAQQLANEHGVRLRALWDTDDGLVGALAGVGLAASGQDGRFVLVGRLRELSGCVSVNDVVRAGVLGVCLLDGAPVHEGVVAPAEKIRPSIVDHQPLLYVEPRGDGTFAPLRLDKAPCYG